MATLTRVICERRAYSPQPSTHRHPYAQLVIPITGRLDVAIGRRRPDDGDEARVIFIPPAEDHSFAAPPGNEFFVFDIPRQRLGQSGRGPGEFKLSYGIDTRWQALRTLLAGEIAAEPADGQAVAALLDYSLSLLAAKNVPPSLQYINGNYHKRITVQQLADIEHYNLSHYHEWFAARTGTTPRLYIRKLRVEKAKELLCRTPFSVLQIAQQVGYEYQASFTKAFRAQEGITPADFRGQSRAGNKLGPRPS